MKKSLKTATLLTLTATVIATGFALPQTAKAAETTDNTPIYRLYNPDNGEHLYTTDANERDTLYATYGWGYEGVAWYSANEGTPVYRLYNNVLCNHLYTTDLNEIRVLTSMDNTAWTVDNNNEPLFYSAGDVSIYRVYNEGLNGMHHLTTDRNEYDTLPTYGWTQEGVSLKAVAVGEPITTDYANGRTGVNDTTSYAAFKNAKIYRDYNHDGQPDYDDPRNPEYLSDELCQKAVELGLSTTDNDIIGEIYWGGKGHYVYGVDEETGWGTTEWVFD